MLMRTDPFRDLDRLTQQVFGTGWRWGCGLRWQAEKLGRRGSLPAISIPFEVQGGSHNSVGVLGFAVARLSVDWVDGDGLADACGCRMRLR